jgi:hypothetical protein
VWRINPIGTIPCWLGFHCFTCITQTRAECWALLKSVTPVLPYQLIQASLTRNTPQTGQSLSRHGVGAYGWKVLEWQVRRRIPLLKAPTLSLSLHPALLQYFWREEEGLGPSEEREHRAFAFNYFRVKYPGIRWATVTPSRAWQGLTITSMIPFLCQIGPGRSWV